MMIKLPDMWNNAPAEPLEEDVVALGAELDSAEQRHRRVALLLLEHDRVQVLDGHPPENGPSLESDETNVKLEFVPPLHNTICLNQLLRQKSAALH